MFSGNYSNYLIEKDPIDMIVTGGKGWLTFPETRLNGFESNAFRDFFATPSRIIDANRCQAELKENALATPVSLEH
ncbi:hypothetical protein WN48_03433 [Eufriesea mexicana]|uniref:Uncharacterized protein n=1 Tax=Eufriesea mexicana TaxID=516756 RepID=A0A310SNC0_9HYME|nr:hypothetical protein WN48_03433 [Eufriesea mexicana]